MNARELTPLPGTEPCRGCGQPRHPLVGRIPCPTCGTVRWTLAIAGSRAPAAHLDDVLAAARSGPLELRERMGGWPVRVLHGNTPGVARVLAARLHEAGWPVEALPADWDRHGRRAGVLRDLSLLARSDALLAIWDATSVDAGRVLDLAAKRDLAIACRGVAPPHAGGIRDAWVWCSERVEQRRGRGDQHTDSSSGAEECIAGGGR